MTPSPSAVPPHPPIHLPSSPTAYKFSYRLINTSLTTPLPSDPPNADGTPYIGDYETMRQMRVECGWGLERLEKEWVDEKGNYPFWIFYLRPIKGGADYRGSEEPAGTARDTSLHTNGTATDSISANSENPLSTGITPSHTPPPSLAQTSASSTAYPATPTSTSMVTDDESEEDRNTYKQGDILVGMGGLVLDLENDQGMASRAEGRVKLGSCSSFFIIAINPTRRWYINVDCSLPLHLQLPPLPLPRLPLLPNPPKPRHLPSLQRQPPHPRHDALPDDHGRRRG